MINKISLTLNCDPYLRDIGEIGKYLENRDLDRVKMLQKLVTDNIKRTDLVETTSEHDSVSSSKKFATGSVNAFIAELTENHCRKVSEADAISKECQVYFALKPDKNFATVLNFWKFYDKQMPQLAAVAKSIYCIPATSVPSEQVFSTSGLTLNAKRSSLSAANVNKIICIHNNYDVCKL